MPQREGKLPGVLRKAARRHHSFNDPAAVEGFGQKEKELLNGDQSQVHAQHEHR
jgi:hypothetical protein